MEGISNIHDIHCEYTHTHRGKPLIDFFLSIFLYTNGKWMSEETRTYKTYFSFLKEMLYLMFFLIKIRLIL